MKKLIVSLKTSSEVLDDFKNALKIKKKNFSGKTHYEISFDTKKDFNRFIRNIDLLTYIISFRPKSVYELARISGMDVSNLNKIIKFFEEMGVIKIKSSIVSGREVKTPLVDYDEIIFKLAA
jgi:predicted transcriptional regulator